MNEQTSSRPFLCLGTVQTGMTYGLSGRGIPDEATATGIFDAAAAAGIQSFDTARSYGLAEGRLGAWLRRTQHECEVISKFTKLVGLADDDAELQMAADCAASSANLGRDELDAMLVHHPHDILRPAVHAALLQLRDSGRIRTFGASVYEVAEARAALEVTGLGILQVPLSLLDRRFAESGILDHARRKGVRIYARSLFTQGLLLIPPEQLPAHLSAAAPVLSALRHLAEQSGYSLQRIALSAVSDLADGLVVGCDNQEQVKELASVYNAAQIPSMIVSEAIFISEKLPRGIADPRNWT